MKNREWIITIKRMTGLALFAGLAMALAFAGGCGSGGGSGVPAAPSAAAAMGVTGMVILQSDQTALAGSPGDTVARASERAAAGAAVVACGAVPDGYVPVPDATVTVSGESASTVTDANGCFDMTLQAPGLKVFTVVKTNALNGTTVLKKAADVQPGTNVQFVGEQSITVYSTAAALVVESRLSANEQNIDAAAIEDYVKTIKNHDSVSNLVAAIVAGARQEGSFQNIDPGLISQCKAATDAPVFMDAALTGGPVPRAGGAIAISADVFAINSIPIETVTATLAAPGAAPVDVPMSSSGNSTYAAAYPFAANTGDAIVTYAVTLTARYLDGHEATFSRADFAVSQCGGLCPGEIPKVCGDGILNGTEQCDAGAANTDTACTPSYAGACSYCTTGCRTAIVLGAACGDGVLNGTEQCDAGAANTDTVCTPAYGQSCSYCNTSCRTVTESANAYCGDGTLNGGEACDAGNANTDTACTAEYGSSCAYCDTSCESHTVQGESCGDGTINGEEQCDSGQANTDTACSAEYGSSCNYCNTACHTVTVQGESCGDGTVNGEEACDAGENNTNTACTPEYGSSCSYCDAACESHTVQPAIYCGDGTVNGGEACDDGNTVTEACAYGQTSCTVCGAACTNVAGAAAFCGDGHVDADNGETCDEAATNGTFGHCNATCNGTVNALCGNGEVEEGEACDAGGANTDTVCSAAYGGTCSYCDTACDSHTVQGPRCGDGVLAAANGEQCDDGNTATGDGCTSSCMTEFSYSNNTYFISDDTKSWPDAQAACQARGGYLFTTNNEAENLYFFNRLDPSRQYWMGYNDRDSEGHFAWTSGALNGFTKWYSGEPNNAGGNEDCTVFGWFNGGYWNDLNCATSLYYVCEIGPDCGNGVIEAGEACDSGASTGQPGSCNITCTGITPATCGNGPLDPGEACDDGNNVTESCAYGLTSCSVCAQSCVILPGVTSYCGDGRVNSAGGEQCDDGNTANGDGCSSTCANEA